MQLLCPESIGTCLPVTIGEGASSEGPRIGGQPPCGVVPSARTALTRYLLTLPLTMDGLEVSIFVSFDFDLMAEASRRVEGHDELLEMVIHGPSQRRESGSDFVSDISPHPMIIHPPRPDWIVADGMKIVESGHKIGGRPYIEQPFDTLSEEADGLVTSGFMQVLQLAFPSGAADANVHGDWPFASGVFHVFVRQDEAGSANWRSFWEF